MAKNTNTNSLADLIEKRNLIALDLVDIYWEMKPPKQATDKELSEFTALARIAGERGKIGMKAIDKLETLIAMAGKEKPTDQMGGFTDEEIKLIMEHRKNGKSKPSSPRSKA